MRGLNGWETQKNPSERDISFFLVVGFVTETEKFRELYLKDFFVTPKKSYPILSGLHSKVVCVELRRQEPRGERWVNAIQEFYFTVLYFLSFFFFILGMNEAIDPLVQNDPKRYIRKAI